MNGPLLRIACGTEGCANYLVIGADDHLPHAWTCPVCRDALELQMLEDLARRHAQHEPLIRAEEGA